MTAAEISQSLTLSSLNARSWHVQACCALTGEGYVCFKGYIDVYVNIYSRHKCFNQSNKHIFFSFILQLTSKFGLDAYPCFGKLVHSLCFFLNPLNCWKRGPLKLLPNSQCLLMHSTLLKVHTKPWRNMHRPPSPQFWTLDTGWSMETLHVCVSVCENVYCMCVDTFVCHMTPF